MVRIIRSLAAEDGTRFDDIQSFVTESFVGVWNGVSESFLLMSASADYFEAFKIPFCKSYEELDSAVMKICGEHVLAVSESGRCLVKLEDDYEEDE